MKKSKCYVLFVVGKSTNSQRIERLWKNAFEGCISLFYTMFLIWSNLVYWILTMTFTCGVCIMCFCLLLIGIWQIGEMLGFTIYWGLKETPHLCNCGLGDWTEGSTSSINSEGLQLTAFNVRSINFQHCCYFNHSENNDGFKKL